ncbi:cytochrome ubiquinol oxidase subunit II [Brevibacillus sp. SYP-B805]|uniref:ubiquinol oxidase subunit II n=1 Tax=Brevibacillus sp. SYP-B805 TaxID=1578199 RepID=UPI0013ECBD63|nr:COX aromatic rich motif-containing protein [Brevibacillus sp. SYP-B805]NGQ96580.1 cytochrome ubiquinol oxidase subunit II [Brevibacillus sp. SYP-B805]
MRKRDWFHRGKWMLMAAMATLLLAGCDNRYLVLNPKGPVAETEYRLIVLSAVLCAAVVIPVLALLAFIIYRYRDKPDNKAPYKPDWAHSTTLEVVWWGIPIVIIAILGYFTARTTFALVKPPVTDATPITIQVTSLDWKWLFTYPDQKVATVNYVEIPAGVPVQFVLTSDAPMNSFWVPQLGGQEYTMPGMAMRLWLQADHPGEYFGQGANFTGKGFAHMQFKVIAKPQAEFEAWAQNVRKTAPAMTKEDYTALAKPGLSETRTYSSYPEGLFEEIVKKNGGQEHDHSMNHDGMTHTP